MKNIINTLNLNSSEIEVLNEYCTNKFTDVPEASPDGRDYLSGWNTLLGEVEESGVESVLNSTLCKSHPVKFAEPEAVRIEIYNCSRHSPILKL